MTISSAITPALWICAWSWKNGSRRTDFPVMFYTEASMDLARKTALVDAMVKANFFYVFLGIESPRKNPSRDQEVPEPGDGSGELY